MKYFIRLFAVSWFAFDLLSIFLGIEWTALIVVPLMLLAFSFIDDKQFERTLRGEER